MKLAKWMFIVGGAVALVGVAVSVGRTPAKRLILYGELRQHGMPPSVAQLMARYWPERFLTWALKATVRYDLRTNRMKKQATKVLHLPPRPRFSARRARTG